jgi:toxin ParE1/3/4
MSQFTISLEATRDLNEIFDYFCDRNIETGERFVQEFDKKCRNLVNFPMMGRSYAEVKQSYAEFQ